jgi:single-strand DNA-binding protein
MASINRVTIIGNCGKDPELRYSPSGTAFCSLSIATTRSWKNKESGEKQEETEWHRVMFNDKLAEIVGQYVKKGKPIYVEGRLKTRKWTNKEGVEVYTTEIMANEMQLLGNRDDDGGGEQRQAPAPRAQAPAPRQQAPAPRGPGSATRAIHGDDEYSDDIPF